MCCLSPDFRPRKSWICPFWDCVVCLYCRLCRWWESYMLKLAEICNGCQDLKVLVRRIWLLEDGILLGWRQFHLGLPRGASANLRALPLLLASLLCLWRDPCGWSVINLVFVIWSLRPSFDGVSASWILIYLLIRDILNYYIKIKFYSDRLIL